MLHQPPGTSQTSPKASTAHLPVQKEAERWPASARQQSSRSSPASCAASRDGLARLPGEPALPLLPRHSPTRDDASCLAHVAGALRAAALPPHPGPGAPDGLAHLLSRCPAAPSQVPSGTRGHLGAPQVAFSPLGPREALWEGAASVASILKMRKPRLREGR